MDADALLASILAHEPAARRREDAALPAVAVPLDRLGALLRSLRDHAAYSFDMLLTHTVVDRLEDGRFELVYVLLSTRSGHTLIVTSDTPRENPIAPSVSAIYRVAHWHEREVYDMFGVRYEGHTDLRRLFLEDDWAGHPLRRDYVDPFMLERPA